MSTSRLVDEIDDFLNVGLRVNQFYGCITFSVYEDFLLGKSLCFFSPLFPIGYHSSK